MTAIILGETPLALDERAEKTADKLGRQFGAQIDWDDAQEKAADPDYAPVDPGISKAEILAEHGPDMAYAPTWQYATFRVAMGTRLHQYEAQRNENVNRWVIEMDKLGWDLDTSAKIHCAPGPYPSRDLTTNLEVPGYRDILVAASFIRRNPVVRRIELPAELFEPTNLLEPLPHERGGR